MISVFIAIVATGLIALILALYVVFTREEPLAGPADVPDPDGTVTSAWLRQLADPAPLQGAALDRGRHEHHEVPPWPSLAELVRAPGLPAAGLLDMLPPDPPPADTIVQPILKDVAVCELGQPVEAYIDDLFAAAEREIGVLAAEVLS